MLKIGSNVIVVLALTILVVSFFSGVFQTLPSGNSSVGPTIPTWEARMTVQALQATRYPTATLFPTTPFVGVKP